MTGPATVRTSRAAHVEVTVYCKACGHDRLLDLADMEARGLGDAPLLGLPLRCRCGSGSYGVFVSGPQWNAKTLKAAQE